MIAFQRAGMPADQFAQHQFMQALHPVAIGTVGDFPDLKCRDLLFDGARRTTQIAQARQACETCTFLPSPFDRIYACLNLARTMIDGGSTEQHTRTRLARGGAPCHSIKPARLLDMELHPTPLRPICALQCRINTSISSIIAPLPARNLNPTQKRHTQHTPNTLKTQ
ncbi:hypothetical protein P4110_29825 [Pseudomonas aeruginosa]|nr:hypothetical protein [Pseudomonas aeruginosa]